MAKPVFLLISLFLVSCAMGPDFKQPQTALPEGFRMATSDGEAKSIANLPWLALRLANLRYNGGVANYLDVLIAQRNLFEAELSFTATHRLHLVSIVQLYKALGGGWAHERDAKKGVG